MKYLTGYRMAVDAETVPAEYGITYYRVGDNESIDSDLRQEDYTLLRPEEYVILAAESSENQNYTTVEVTDEFHEGVSYDFLTAKDHSGQDGGLVAFPKASITGRIWEDANYNGVQDTDEHGIANVTVALKSYYYDGTWHDADGFNFPTTAVTDENGIYTFVDLPTYVEVDGVKYLTGYRMAVDAETVPAEYGITYYRVGGNESIDSDLRQEDCTLLRPEEYVILAAESSENQKYTTVEVTDEFHTGVSYDFLTAQSHSGQDGGLVAFPKASITGRIWEDANYNGVQDKKELGIAGISVQLSQYYFADGKWLAVEGFATTSQTDENGIYTFVDLPTYVEVDGVKYLTGYRMAVDAETVPAEYGITYYRVGDDESIDSDLRQEDYTLLRPEEYVILAAETSTEVSTTPNYTTVEVTDEFHEGVSYDFLTAKDHSGQDGGLVTFPKASITGRIWEDANYNGVQDKKELGIAGISVQLSQYYFADGKWLAVEGFATTSQTDENGIYTFTDLPTYVEVDGVKYLTGYRMAVDAETVPAEYGITYYRVGDNESIDSDLRQEDYTLLRPEEYVILAAETSTEVSTTPNYTTVEVTDTFHEGVSYDFLTAQSHSGQDGGLVAFPKASITGRIWEDANYNGVQDTDEHGIANVTVALKSYYYDGTWHDADGFNFPTTAVTDENGIYTFTDLPTYVEVDGVKYLTGYRMAVDVETVPAEYGITYYRVGDDESIDSDLRQEDYTLLRPEEYVILAAETSTEVSTTPNYTTVEVTDEFHEGVSYDFLTAQSHSGQDGGLVAFPKASITGRIWEDANYNGVQDKKELGIAGISVQLSQYYFADGKWLAVEAFLRTDDTDADGIYTFVDLPTYVEVDGVKYLAGYRMNTETLPAAYAVTRYRVGENRLTDSDLMPSGTLVREGEYIPVAATCEENRHNDGSTVTVLDLDNGELTYDMLLARHVTGQDGGLLRFENGSIRGKIWMDDDQDGMLDRGEKGVPIIRVELTQYVREDGKWLPVDSFLRTEVTDAEGNYLFDNLPLYLEKSDEEGNVIRQMTGYRLQLQPIPEQYAITEYRVNNGVNDSKLIAEDLTLRESNYELDGCLVIAAPAQSDTTIIGYEEQSFYQEEGFDLVRPENVTRMDGGVWKVEIPDYAPDTGDHMGNALGLCLMSGLLCAVLFPKRRKRKE